MKIYPNVIRCLCAMCLVLCLCYCKPPSDVVSNDASFTLDIPVDTVLFDTLFTTVGSTTAIFKVYNRSSNAVRISRVAVGAGSLSNYSLTVNGQQNHEINNLLLRGKDSILVMVSVTINPQDKDLPFIVEDSIEFFTNGNRQKVLLNAWGQDAYFVKDSLMACDTLWSGKRPIVLYKPVMVDKACTLTIDSGVTVYGYGAGGLHVHGSLKINGTCSAPVKMLGTRDLTMAGFFASGQWSGIRFYETSQHNELNHVFIKNAVTGIRFEGAFHADTLPEIIINNSEIYNSSEYNLFLAGIDASIHSSAIAVGSTRNTVFAACRNIRLIQNTFASYNITLPNAGNYFINKYKKANDTELLQEAHLTMFNNVVWGSRKTEIEFVTEPGTPEFLITKAGNIFVAQDVTLSADSNSVYNFFDKKLIENGVEFDKTTDNTFGSGLIKFKDPFRFDYRIDSGSVAVGRGVKNEFIPQFDIRCNEVGNKPNAGAYRYESE